MTDQPWAVGDVPWHVWTESRFDSYDDVFTGSWTEAHDFLVRLLDWRVEVEKVTPYTEMRTGRIEYGCSSCVEWGTTQLSELRALDGNRPYGGDVDGMEFYLLPDGEAPDA